MSKVRVDEDIRPLSEFRAEMASFVKHIHETRRPMVLTQRGRGVAVLIDVHQFESMQERLEILEDIYRAEEQLAAGGGVPHEEARARILKGDHAVRVEWSPLALDRISDIARYIAKDNPDAAERWVNELFDSVERLADFPESGRVVPEVGVRRIREVIFGAYRVIYSVKDKVEILTVRRGSQRLRLSEIDHEHE
jgi:prevent-host-death family protein/addiction module RelE/StbE family toxin